MLKKCNFFWAKGYIRIFWGMGKGGLVGQIRFVKRAKFCTQPKFTLYLKLLILNRFFFFVLFCVHDLLWYIIFDNSLCSKSVFYFFLFVIKFPITSLNFFSVLGMATIKNGFSFRGAPRWDVLPIFRSLDLSFDGKGVESNQDFLKNLFFY